MPEATGDLSVLVTSAIVSAHGLIATLRAWEAACRAGDTTRARQHWRQAQATLAAVDALLKTAEARAPACTGAPADAGR